MIKIIIPGRPVPAVRMTQRSRYKNPAAQRYIGYKNYIAWTARKAFKRPDESGLFRVLVRVYVYGGNCGDWDNYGKTACDGLNKILYKDDKQVKRGTVEVLTVDNEEDQRMEIYVKKLDKWPDGLDVKGWEADASEIVAGYKQDGSGVGKDGC